MGPGSLIVPPKPAGKGRFDPSEPLHMTTRGANKRNSRTTNSSSVNGSDVDGGDSRRQSLDMPRPSTSGSLGSQTSGKGRRTSGGSINGRSDMSTFFASQTSIDQQAGQDISQPLSAPDQRPYTRQSLSLSPSRKRKRSSATPPRDPSYGLHSALSGTITTTTERNLDTIPDTVVVVPPEELSDREDSQASSDDEDDDDPGDYLAATQSTEVTPAASPAGSGPVSPESPSSPASEESQPTPSYPIKHASMILTALRKTAEIDDTDDIDEIEDMADGDDVDDVDEGEDGDELGHTGPRRRMTGRRRANHHVPEVEAMMRRQLQLKSAYRAISRALKPVLAEVAYKTVEDLEANASLYEQVVEYEGTEEFDGIQNQLDEYLAQRKARLDAQLKHQQAQLRDRHEGELFVRKSRFDLQLGDLRDLQLDRMEHEFLTIVRQGQTALRDAGYETEDEDNDVIMKPKGMGYRFQRKDALDSRYDSRSRLALESERAVQDIQRRIDMHTLLEDAIDDEHSNLSEGFTTMDKTAREAALHRRESMLNTTLLAEAAAEIDRVANIPVIRNEEAIGLQLLGDLASRPSIRVAVAPPPVTPQHRHRDLGSHGYTYQRPPFPGPQGPLQMPPPSNLRSPFGFEAAPEGRQRVPLMSPRTEKLIAEHYGVPLLPGPGQPPTPIHRPAVRQGELFSPTALAGHNVGFPPPPVNPPDGKHTYRKTPLTPDHGRLPSQETPDHTTRSIHRTNAAGPGKQEQSNAIPGKLRHLLHGDGEYTPPRPRGRSFHEFSGIGPLSIERIRSEPDEQLQQASKPPLETKNVGQPQLAASVEFHPKHEKQLSLPDNSVDSTRAQTSADEQIILSGAAGKSGIHRSDHLPAKPIPRWDQPRREGAIDTRHHGEAGVPEDAVLDHSREIPAKKSRSRASSFGQSTTTDVEGSQDGSTTGDAIHRRQSRQALKDPGIVKKPSKAQRHGLSRKGFKESKSGNKRQGVNQTTHMDHGGSMLRFRLNQETPKPTPTHQNGPPTGTPRSAHTPYPFPPLPSYNEQQQSHPFPLPPPGYPVPPPPPPPYLGSYDPGYHFHRNSFPGLSGVAPPPWPPSGPPGHTYGLPHGSPPLPTAEAWPGSPTSNGSVPQAPLRHSGPPTPATQPPPQGARYNGPSIAPATPDARFPQLGSGPGGGNHPPAFAQQQRQLDGNGNSSRRRAQSDIRGTKFHHYPGPRNRE